MQFTARHDFWSPEAQSQYVGGLNYTADSPELQKIFERWMREGKMERTSPTARLSGKG